MNVGPANKAYLPALPNTRQISLRKAVGHASGQLAARVDVGILCLHRSIRTQEFVGSQAPRRSGEQGMGSATGDTNPKWETVFCEIGGGDWGTSM